jgi:hypothetical protein
MTKSYIKTILKAGNGRDVPAKGDRVRIAYTGWLRDAGNEDYEKGAEYVNYFFVSFSPTGYLLAPFWRVGVSAWGVTWVFVGFLLIGLDSPSFSPDSIALKNVVLYRR